MEKNSFSTRFSNICTLINYFRNSKYTGFIARDVKEKRLILSLSNNASDAPKLLLKSL